MFEPLWSEVHPEPGPLTSWVHILSCYEVGAGTMSTSCVSEKMQCKKLFVSIPILAVHVSCARRVLCFQNESVIGLRWKNAFFLGPSWDEAGENCQRAEMGPVWT